MSEQLRDEGQVIEDVVIDWSSMVIRKLSANVSGMTQGKRVGFVTRKDGTKESKLSASLKTRTGKMNGEISNVSFSFERHGVFVHKGVGRGPGGINGMVVRKATISNPRKPNEWFNPVINDNLPELADKLVEREADAVFNATRLIIQ